ncbi:MAG: hypothetical protein IJA09_06990 [Bacteroidales bacterium]|nr:hypothetical protein [Bacteroidales bacterium]
MTDNGGWHGYCTTFYSVRALRCPKTTTEYATSRVPLCLIKGDNNIINV